METDEQIGVGDIVTIPRYLDVKYVVRSVDNDCVELVFHDSYIGTPFWILKKYVRLAR